MENPAGISTLTIATGLTDTTHKLLLHRRSEYFDGTDTFLGLELDTGKTLLTPPARPAKKIEFYGDSITVGLGLDDPGSATENDTTNNYMSYGAQTARNLNLEYHCQAISGIGLVGGWGQMSDHWNLTNPADAASTWDFNQWVPDVIVQNLGQNDQWQATPSVAEAIQGYVDYVQMYRGAYGPNVPIVLAIGSMQASQSGSPWPGYIQSAIDELQSTYNDFKVTKCIFPFGGLANWDFSIGVPSFAPGTFEPAAQMALFHYGYMDEPKIFYCPSAKVGNSGYIDKLDHWDTPADDYPNEADFGWRCFSSYAGYPTWAGYGYEVSGKFDPSGLMWATDEERHDFQRKAAKNPLSRGGAVVMTDIILESVGTDAPLWLAHAATGRDRASGGNILYNDGSAKWSKFSDTKVLYENPTRSFIFRF